MTLDEVLASLFPSGHSVEHGSSGTVHGVAKVDGQRDAVIVGIVGGAPLGVDGAIVLAGHVLTAVKAGGGAPIVVLVDTASQNMARRDELLGLNEYLAHLAKSLTLAAMRGHPTVSVLFGHAAAGAFIATALSSESLVALPGAKKSSAALICVREDHTDPAHVRIAAPLLGHRTFATTERYYQQARGYEAHRAFVDALFGTEGGSGER